jgi:hypothetical protein
VAFPKNPIPQAAPVRQNTIPAQPVWSPFRLTHAVIAAVFELRLIEGSVTAAVKLQCNNPQDSDFMFNWQKTPFLQKKSNSNPGVWLIRYK